MKAGSEPRKQLIAAVVTGIWLLMLIAGYGCGGAQTTSELMLASTTSTYDTGLFDVLLPAFEAANPGYEIKVNAVGTGKALELGRSCDADVLLVHAPEAEKQFVAEGYGVERHEIMYNDFVIVGPEEDPAGIAAAGGDAVEGRGGTAAAALSKLAVAGQPFISRGDDSGTNKAELRLWRQAGVEPQGDWYRSVGQGMGATLRIALETGPDGAYTLSDRGTFLSMRDALPGMVILVEGDPALFNQYGAIAIDPEHCPGTDIEGAQAFIRWLESDDGQELIGSFGLDTYGRNLFVPDAQTGGAG